MALTSRPPRPVHTLAGPTAPSSDSISLSRALNALSSKILTPDPSAALQYSVAERAKTSANLEYARTLLLRLERSAVGVRVQSKKQAAQIRLAEQRVLVKQLTERLYEYGQRDAGLGWQQEPDETILELLNPVEKLTGSKVDTLDEIADEINRGSNRATTGSSSSSTNPDKISPSHKIESHLRSRRALLGPEVTSTGLSHHSPASPKTPPRLNSSNESHAPSSSAAAILDAQSSTQAELTSSMVQLAEKLRESAKQFADDLAVDAEALMRTEGALGKNQDGLNAATRKMSVLSRMSEGRWWLGRMMLYAVIVVLWVLATAIVFLGPKIRF